MPKIPLAGSAGIGEANYRRVAETPELGRPVQQALGPKREVYPLAVKQEQAAPLSQFKPVLPSPGEWTPVFSGMQDLARHVGRLEREKQLEIQRTNEAAEKTDLLVKMGDMKSEYRKNTLDVINSPEMPEEEKAKNLQKLEEDFKGFVGTVKPAYQPVVASDVMGTIGSVKAHADDVFLRNRQDQIKGNIEQRVNQLVLDAGQTGDLAGTMANFDAMQGAFKSAGLSEAVFQDQRHRFEQSILQTDIMGNLKTVDSKSGEPALATITDLLTRLEEKDADGAPVNWPRLDPATRNADIAAAISKKNQIEADLKTSANKGLDQLKSNFSVGMAYFEDSLKNGDPVPDDLRVALHQQAEAMIRLDPGDKAGAMGRLRLEQVERQYGPGYRNEQAAKDPLFGTGVKPISFADVSSPEALQAKLAENIQIGRAVQEAKGLSFVPVLRNQDMEGIAQTIESNPANGIRMVDALKNALGKDGSTSLTYLAGQMANSKDPSAPAVAAIIYNVGKGDMGTAQTLAHGMEVMKTKAITMPKDVDLRDRFNRLIGDAMAESSANRGIQFEAYKTAYAAMAARKSVVDGNFDRGIAEEAFKRTVGTVTSWNGSDVLVPDGWDEDRFRDYLGGITPETIEAWGGVHGMTNDRAVDFLQDDAMLRAVGPGRYTVEYNGRLLLTPGGRQFILDTRQPLLSRKAAAGPEGVEFAGPAELMTP